jgi:single-strand DNA-binding protein
MSANNSVHLYGRFARDPELKYLPTGKAVCVFTLAVRRTKDDADFIDCVAWEKRAELIANSFSKGSRIAVEGQIRTRTYDTRDGDKRKVVEVTVDGFEFIDSKAESVF